MRKRTNGVALAATFAVALVATVTLAGCVQSPPHVIPTSESSSKPVFATDAAALAAAKKAFSRYLAISDAIAHDGGVNVQRLSPVDSPSQLKDDSRSFAKMKASGHHTAGSSDFSNAALESSEVLDGKARVVAYICMQIGGTTLLDDSGADVGADRPLSVPLEVSFLSSADRASTLIIDRSVGWSGKNFCS